MKRKLILSIVFSFLFVGMSYGATVTKGLIGKQDTSIYSAPSDGYTFTRSTSAGYTLTLNKFDWVGVDVLQVYGGGVSWTDTTIAAAVAGIGTTENTKAFIGPGDWVIDADLDLSTYSNIFFEIAPGADLQVSTGKTLTIYSPENIIASPRQQIFSGLGLRKFSTGGKAEMLWWGVYDGVDASAAQRAANTIAIQKAIDDVIRGYGWLHVPEGNYVHDGDLKIDHIQDTYTSPFNVYDDECHGFSLIGDNPSTTVFWNMGQADENHLTVGRFDSVNDVHWWNSGHNGTTLIANGFPPVGIQIKNITLAGDEDSGHGLVMYAPYQSLFENVAAFAGDEKTNFQLSKAINCVFNRLKISAGNQWLANITVPTGFSFSLDTKYGFHIKTIREHLTNTGGTTFRHYPVIDTTVDYMGDDFGVNRSDVNAEAASIIVEGADQTGGYAGETFLDDFRGLEIMHGQIQIKYGYNVLIRRANDVTLYDHNLENINPTQADRTFVRLDETRNIILEHFNDDSGGHIELDDALNTRIRNSRLGATLQIYDITTAETLILEGNTVSKAHDTGTEAAWINLSEVVPYYAYNQENHVVDNLFKASFDGAHLEARNNKTYGYNDGWRMNILGVNDYFQPTSAYNVRALGYESGIFYRRQTASALTMTAEPIPIFSGEYYTVSFYAYLGSNSNATVTLRFLDSAYGSEVTIADTYRFMQVIPYVKNAHQFGANTVSFSLGNAAKETWTLCRGIVLAPAGSKHLSLRIADGHAAGDADTYSVMTGITVQHGIHMAIENSSELDKPVKIEHKSLIYFNVAATAVEIMTVPANSTFIPISVSARIDDDMAATNGDYWSVGVSGANRRVDFGVCATAAAANKHSQNAKLRWLNSSELGNAVVGAGETLSILSVDGTGDAAALSNNIGGASGDNITVVYSGWMIKDLPDL